MIESEMTRAFGQPAKLSIEVVNGHTFSDKKLPVNPQLPLPNINCNMNRGRFLRRDFTFDQFVVGGNNDFAYSAALSLASGKRSFQNSLFLVSKTGMGKSHLSQAVGNHILRQFPTERLFYITAEDFSNEMVDAYRTNTIDQFKKKYRNTCDVLLLEDLHHLDGKKRTQVELSLILDVLLESGKKIIFSSCYLPADIPTLDNNLESRLTSGLISTIDPPNFRTRVRILQKKSKTNGCTLPEDVTHYLAGELLEDVRQLESGLIGVTAKSALLGVPINLSLAQSVVKNLIRQRKKITIDVIKKLICKEYNETIRDMVSQSRKQSIVRPRQVAMYLSRQFTDSPLQEIGRSFNRLHATALHAINCVERKLKEETSMQKQIELLCRKLDNGKF
jgi:chromosomal replication initiator protein